MKINPKYGLASLFPVLALFVFNVPLNSQPVKSGWTVCSIETLAARPHNMQDVIDGLPALSDYYISQPFAFSGDLANFNIVSELRGSFQKYVEERHPKVSSWKLAECSAPESLKGISREWDRNPAHHNAQVFITTWPSGKGKEKLFAPRNNPPAQSVAKCPVCLKTSH